MREVKFRGLNRGTNTWYYGSLLLTKQLGIVHAQIWLLEEDYPVPVDLETVGQFTGLEDKNDAEIYEGDIVFLYYSDGSRYEHPIQVKYGLHGIGFESDAGTTGPALGFYFSPYPFDYPEQSSKGELPLGIGEYNWDDTLEVIGNIYEHPELLEEGKQT